MKQVFYILRAVLLFVCLQLCFTESSSAEEEKMKYKQITQEEAKEMMSRSDGHVVVDVRRQEEYDAGHIPGAILIPNESIGCDAPEALPDYSQVILIYCRSGNRSKQAAQKLAEMGYANIYEFGGIIDWTGPVVTAAQEKETVSGGSPDDGKEKDDNNPISRFIFIRGGDTAYDHYEIITIRGDYYLSADGDDFRKIGAGPVDALYQVFLKYDLSEWDGFDGEIPDVLDGEIFSLDIELTDAGPVHARGSNVFPENYNEAVLEIANILYSIEISPSDPDNGLMKFFSRLFPRKNKMTVGTDIPLDAVSEFWYTLDASSYPPYFEQYHFYGDDGGTRFLSHEIREGDHWPLYEEDAVLSETAELTKAQWAEFLSYLEGGTVTARKEDPEDGDSGPWLYLYWNGDQGKYQEFTFSSPDEQAAFEDFARRQ